MSRRDEQVFGPGQMVGPPQIEGRRSSVINRTSRLIARRTARPSQELLVHVFCIVDDERRAVDPARRFGPQSYAASIPAVGA
jgi:hypothetical protein